MVYNILFIINPACVINCYMIAWTKENCTDDTRLDNMANDMAKNIFEVYGNNFEARIFEFTVVILYTTDTWNVLYVGKSYRQLRVTDWWYSIRLVSNWTLIYCNAD